MTRNDLNKWLCMLITTLAEVPGHEAPAGHLYAPLMGHLASSDFDMVVRVMEAGALAVRAPSHMVTLTAKGIALASTINKHLGVNS